MKFTAKRLIATVGVLGLLAAQSTAFAADTNVEFYQDASFTGAHSSSKDGVVDLSKVEIGEKALSSIKIPYGYIVKLYDKTGNEFISLPAGDYNDLSSIGWDNYAAKAEIKHYDAIDYELQVARISKASEISKAEQINQDNLPVTGDVVSEKTDVNLENLRVEPINDSKVEKTELIFSGNTRLTNTTNEKQTLTSQAFDFSEANTVSATTTNAVGTSISASASFNVPIIGSLNTSISTQYNFSKAETNSESKTVTYKIPSQSITLNPGQTVEVRARLEKVKTSGKVKLVGDLNGTESGYISLQRLVPSSTWSYKYKLNTVFKWSAYKKAPYEISFNGKHVEGEGTYEAEYGSNLYIDVVNVDTNKTQTIEITGNQAQADRSANGNSSEFVANSATFDMTK